MNFLRQTFSEKSVCFKHKEKWVIKISPTLPGSAYGTAGGGCYKVFSVGIKCVMCSTKTTIL